MEQNAQGWCYSYYGRWHINDKPRLGVVYFMLDEHIKKTIIKEKEKFQSEIALSIEKFNKSFDGSLKKQSEDIAKLREVISNLNNFTAKVIELNELKKPEIESKPIKSKLKSKKIIKIEKEYEENEDDSYDGYL